MFTAGLKTIVETEDIPMNCGELSLVREAGSAGRVLIRAKSPLIAAYLKEFTGGKTDTGTYGKEKFECWQISDNDAGQFTVPGAFTLFNTDDCMTDRFGTQPALTFLRSTKLGEGIELPVRLPYSVSDFGRAIGTGFQQFLESHLRPYKRTWRFSFEGA